MALAPVWGSVNAGTSVAAAAAGSSRTDTSGSGPRSIAGPYTPMPRMAIEPTTMPMIRPGEIMESA